MLAPAAPWRRSGRARLIPEHLFAITELVWTSESEVLFRNVCSSSAVLFRNPKCGSIDRGNARTGCTFEPRERARTCA